MKKAPMTYLGFTAESLETSPYYPYLRECLAELEWQYQPTEDDRDLDRYVTAADTDTPRKYRIPADGDKNPTANDRPIGYDPQLIKTFGTSWWNWRAGLTVGCMVDVDCGHGEKAHTPEEIAEWDRKVAQCSYLLNVSSKSGKGRHGVVLLENPQPARIRAEHKANCKRIVAKLCADLGISPDFFCKWGEIQYVFHRDHA